MQGEAEQTHMTPKHRTLIKPGELVLLIVLIILAIVLTTTFMNKLTLKHDVAKARTVSDKVVTDINKRDGAALRAQGSPKFQKTYSAAQLTQGFKNVEIATLKTPRLDRQIVVNSPSGRTVYFVYKYTALKVPFYVRTGIQNQSGHWYLTNIAGNIDETTLTGGY